MFKERLMLNSLFNQNSYIFYDAKIETTKIVALFVLCPQDFITPLKCLRDKHIFRSKYIRYIYSYKQEFGKDFKSNPLPSYQTWMRAISTSEGKNINTPNRIIACDVRIFISRVLTLGK